MVLANSPRRSLRGAPTGLGRTFSAVSARRFCFLTIAATWLTCLTPSAALSTNGDVHSENMRLEANLDTGRGGDLAFWDDLAIVGHGFGYNNEKEGFKVVDISDPMNPKKLGEFNCAMSGADVSVWRDLVILSSDTQTRSTTEGGDPAACEGVEVDPVALNRPGSFSGLRIVSIADPARPKLITSVAKAGSDPGSHTHTLIPDLKNVKDGRPDPRLIVYLNAPLGRQQIIEVPLRRPASARVVGFVDPSPARGCHDTTVLLSVEPPLAACAAFTETQLWDISDLERPVVLSHIANANFDNHHSSAFSWDGKTLVLGDESFKSIGTSSCFAGTGVKSGHLWFYNIENAKEPTYSSDFQIPVGRTTNRCFAHQFNVVPLSDGRDVVVSSWAEGGTTVIDFTDRARPQELGFYVAEPASDERRSAAFASYWYNGFIYVNNTGLQGERGLDVLSIDVPALDKFVEQGHLNAQTQSVARRAG